MSFFFYQSVNINIDSHIHLFLWKKEAYETLIILYASD